MTSPPAPVRQEQGKARPTCSIPYVGTSGGGGGVPQIPWFPSRPVCSTSAPRHPPCQPRLPLPLPRQHCSSRSNMNQPRGTTLAPAALALATRAHQSGVPRHTDHPTGQEQRRRRSVADNGSCVTMMPLTRTSHTIRARGPIGEGSLSPPRHLATPLAERSQGSRRGPPPARSHCTHRSTRHRTRGRATWRVVAVVVE